MVRSIFDTHGSPYLVYFYFVNVAFCVLYVNASTTLNTAAVKILSLFKVGFVAGESVSFTVKFICF